MKKKTAIIIEIYEPIKTESLLTQTITKRIEVYTNYNDGYGFGVTSIFPNITPRAISNLLSTIKSLTEHDFNIKIKFIEDTNYSEENVKKLLY